METIKINLASGPHTFKLVALNQVDENHRFMVYKDGEGYTCACLDKKDCFVMPSKFTFVLDDAIECLNKSVAYYRDLVFRHLINNACDKH